MVVLERPLETSREVLIGLGELSVTADEAVVLACLGLGSCVAVCVYDPSSGVGGMAHVVLPASDGRAPSAKYADHAIPMLLDRMVELGASRSRLRVKLVGAAQMSMALGLSDLFKIGQKNLEAVKGALAREGIRVVAEETGGNHGRTAKLYVDSGRVTVTAASRATVEL